MLNKAVASAKPNREKAKKNNVVASIKATDLKNCNFGYLVFHIFIRVLAMLQVLLGLCI